MTTITCDCCGKDEVATCQEHVPNDGWHLPVDTFGYYGGFSDNLRVLMGQEESNWLVMCHDCVVKFLTTFPMLAEKLTDMGHPNRNKPFGLLLDDEREFPSCCKWAWTAVKTGPGWQEFDLYYGDGNGGWVFVPRKESDESQNEIGSA